VRDNPASGGTVKSADRSDPIPFRRTDGNCSGVSNLTAHCSERVGRN
jgi:hypothetical protein